MKVEANVPIHIAAVFPAQSIFREQLNTGKDSLPARDRAYKTNSAHHVPWNIDLITDSEIVDKPRALPGAGAASGALGGSCAPK